MNFLLRSRQLAARFASRVAIGGLLASAIVVTGCVTNAEQSTAEPPAAAPSAPIVESAAEATTRTGTFSAADHPTGGGVELIVDADGQRLVFDEDFYTDDGPALYVTLHRSMQIETDLTAPNYGFDEGDYVVIEPLQSIEGEQTYAIPDDIDASKYGSVAIWCEAFNVTFGFTSLAADS